MFKIRQIRRHDGDDPVLCGARPSEGDGQLTEKRFHPFSVGNGFPGDDAQRLETAHIRCFLIRHEFLKGLFAGSVRHRVVDGIQGTAVLQFFGTVDGLLVRSTFQHLVAVDLQKRGANGVKGHHLGLGQLREEDGPVFAQHTGQQADLPRFLGTDEVAAHVGGGGQRLELGEPRQKTGGQRAVGKGHVGEPGRFHREFV